MNDKKKKSNQKADKAAPDLSVPNGRDATTGRFTADNKFAVNHIAKHSAILRSALIHRVTPEDIERIVDKLLSSAKNGSYKAIKILLSYCLGSPMPYDILERIEKIEKSLEFNDKEQNELSESNK